MLNGKKIYRKKLKQSPEIIVITGAESTGKSELTKQLAVHFNVPLVPEYAREYVESLKRKYTFNDVEKIALKQVEMLNQYKNCGYRYVFIDTWLIITKVWLEVVFHKVPEWMEDEIRRNRIDLFLVCNTDLPWKPDPVRENGGEMRMKLQQKYIDTIKSYNYQYEIVSGINEKRFINALHILDKRRKNKP